MRTRLLSAAVATMVFVALVAALAPAAGAGPGIRADGSVNESCVLTMTATAPGDLSGDVVLFTVVESKTTYTHQTWTPFTYDAATDVSTAQQTYDMTAKTRRPTGFTLEADVWSDLPGNGGTFVGPETKTRFRTACALW